MVHFSFQTIYYIKTACSDGLRQEIRTKVVYYNQVDLELLADHKVCTTWPVQVSPRATIYVNCRAKTSILTDLLPVQVEYKLFKRTAKKIVFIESR